MIKNDVLYLGLTRVQLQTLLCHFPIGFSFHKIEPDDFKRSENIAAMVNKAWCFFINPKTISADELCSVIEAHKYATTKSHAAILMFTESFSAEQKEKLFTDNLHRVDLRAGLDRNLKTTIEIIRKATMPCWNGMSKMRSNVLNDGWYLLDMETTGVDPLEDDVLSITISYMAEYKIQSTEKLYIRQRHLIASHIEDFTGITNEMLEHGMMPEDVVRHLIALPYKSPLILESTRYYLPFLKALFHSCGKRFDLPFVAMDGLAAITFSHILPKSIKDVYASITDRKYCRTQIDDPYISRLYDVTLSVFEALQDRYGIRAAGDFHELYYGDIECCE